MQGIFEGYYVMIEKIVDGILSFFVFVSLEFKGVRLDVWGWNVFFQLVVYKMMVKNLIEVSVFFNQLMDECWMEVLEKFFDYVIIEGLGSQEYLEYVNQCIVFWEGMDLVESYCYYFYLVGIYFFQLFDFFDEKYVVIVCYFINQWIVEGVGRWLGWCVFWVVVFYVCLGNLDGVIFWLYYWEENYINLGWGILYDVNYKGFFLIKFGIGLDLCVDVF